MNDEYREISLSGPSALVATTVATLVLAASTALWRKHSREANSGRVVPPNVLENAPVPVESEKEPNNRTTRSKDRRRRGKDPMKDLLKGGKKSKDLHKLLDTIPLDPSPSTSAPGEYDSGPRTSSNDIQGHSSSVPPSTSNSSRTDERERRKRPRDNEYSPSIPLRLPTHEEGRGSMSSSSTREPPQSPTTSHGSIPSLTLTATTSSEYSFSASTSDHEEEESLSFTSRSYPRDLDLTDAPAWPESRCAPTYDSDLRLQSFNDVQSDFLDYDTSGRDKRSSKRTEPSSLPGTGELREGRRGRKRNKSPKRQAETIGQPILARHSPQPSPSSPDSNKSLSTQTQIASLRGALEAARLREDKMRNEIETLRWEVEMASKKENDRLGYIHQLTHQLHAYASFAMSMQAMVRQIPPQQYTYGAPGVSSQPADLNASHSPNGTISQTPPMSRSETPSSPKVAQQPPQTQRSDVSASSPPGVVYATPYPPPGNEPANPTTISPPFPLQFYPSPLSSPIPSPWTYGAMSSLSGHQHGSPFQGSPMLPGRESGPHFMDAAWRSNSTVSKRVEKDEENVGVDSADTNTLLNLAGDAPPVGSAPTFPDDSSPTPIHSSLDVDSLLTTFKNEGLGSSTASSPSSSSPSTPSSRSRSSQRRSPLEVLGMFNDHRGFRDTDTIGYTGSDSIYGDGNNFDSPLRDMLEDAILKRPSSLRAVSTDRKSDQELTNDDESHSSVSKASSLPDKVITEFTFPSISNLGNPGLTTTSSDEDNLSS